ncbi:MAG: hypothetical protein EZS28_009852 [Streblomastix strix]|uniref:Uncharacterized protein n=1 Tax=Streblomastix strix TaxID=222440 RepID=A0A5J4WIG3_9EUKA|nr:MAG: hypothetical protein EZS28_009852 [Streblomastix strix]
MILSRIANYDLMMKKFECGRDGLIKRFALIEETGDEEIDDYEQDLNDGDLKTDGELILDEKDYDQLFEFDLENEEEYEEIEGDYYYDEIYCDYEQFDQDAYEYCDLKDKIIVFNSKISIFYNFAKQQL